MVLRYAKERGIHLTGEWQQYCKGCSVGNTHRKPVPKVTSCRSGKRLGRVFIDLRMGWLRFLRSKDETTKVVRAFIRDVAEVENIRIGCVRTDEGTEFKNVDFEDVLDERKIRHEYTLPGTPQLNGKVER
ncbi:unnamed protein product, partial [Choristocarpus tenellus]